MTGDLFAALERTPAVETITDGAWLLRAFIDHVKSRSPAARPVRRKAP